MSRRHAAEKREVLPDAKYGSLVVTKFMNTMMYAGKKSVAEGIVYGAFEQMQKKVGGDPVKLFTDALDNVKPQLEVRSRRVGGATYQVPVEINPERQVAIGLRWIVTYAKGRKGQSMKNALASELLDAFDNTGSAVKKKEDTHKMAQANKAFAHYKW